VTVYENLKEMLALAEELHAKFKAEGNEQRATIYAQKVAQHKAELAGLA